MASSRPRSRGRGGRRGRRHLRRSSHASARGTPRRDAARSRALAVLLDRGRNGVVAGRDRARPRRVREDVHLCDPGRARRRASVRSNARSVSVGKPTIASVVRLKSRERLEPAQERARPCSGAPSSRSTPSSPDCSGHVQMPADRRRLAQRARSSSASTWLISIDDRRRRSRPGDRADLADEPRRAS